MKPLTLCDHWSDVDDRCEEQVDAPGEFCPLHDPFLEPDDLDDFLRDGREECA